MAHFRAAWLIPIAQPPIRDGWILTDAGRIVAYGHSRAGDMTPAGEVDLENVAIVPGLVNAHTHLELSWLRGRIAETEDFPGWIRSVMAHIARAEAHAEEAARATEDAIDEAKRYGTVLVGDVSNTLGTSRALAERNLAAVVFHELIGFAGSNAPRIIAKWAKESARLGETSSGDLIRHFPAAHAPYSVSPALFGEIRKALGDEALARTSVHLGESKAEIEFLAKGTGPWRTLLDEVNAWDDAWQVPGCTPVEYLDRQHFVEPRTLVVHGVHLPSGDLRRLAEREATLVTCPRGNIRTGAGTPPIGRFYESGVRVAIGTDSLASVPDLNLFSELAEMRRLAPGVPAGALLASATLNGAEALGYGKLFGSIQPGKSDRLLAIDLPDGLTDVEEYLVSGVQPSRIRWLAGPA